MGRIPGRTPGGSRHRAHPGGWAGVGYYRVVGQVGGQMGGHRHRADSRSAAAVGDAERLVQVQVGYVGAELPRLGHPYEGVEVGPIEVHLAAVGVDEVAHLGHSGLVHPVGGRVGDHQGAEPVVVLDGLDFQVVHVHVAVVVAGHYHHPHPGHDGAGRIGAVGRGRDEAHVALGIAPTGVVAPDGQQPGQLALGAGVRLERHGGIAGDGHQHLLQFSDQRPVALGLGGRGERVDGRELRPADRLHLSGGV